MPRYNQYNRNRLSLNTVDFQPTVFTPIEFKPVEQDYSILERAMAKQEERKQKALAQQANIKAAISQVELDESEDEWKQNYINNITKQINDAAAVGDYAGALETATTLAGDVAIDPALLGRERYNKERKKYLEELKAKKDRGDISEDSYQRAVAVNKYNYIDTFDDNGNIVGGSTWESNYDPRKKIDFAKVLAEMQTFIGVSSETIGGGGGSKQIFNYTYTGPDGKEHIGTTTNPNQSNILTVKGVQKGGSSTESTKQVTAQDWKNAFDAYLARHPEEESNFYQMWDDELWMYDNIKRQLDENPNLTAEQRASLEESKLTRENSLRGPDGTFLTKDAWILKRIQPSFDVMAYKQHSLVSEAGSTLYDADVINRQTVAKAMFTGPNGFSQEGYDLYTAGAPQEYWQRYLQNTTEMTINLNGETQNFLNRLSK